jgi:CheY-like chemotaxis protein
MMNVTPVPILLVDDRRENLVALSALLDEIDGLELVHATSGAEALRLLLTREFGLVLMDVQIRKHAMSPLSSSLR